VPAGDNEEHHPTKEVFLTRFTDSETVVAAHLHQQHWLDLQATRGDLRTAVPKEPPVEAFAFADPLFEAALKAKASCSFRDGKVIWENKYQWIEA